MVLLKNRALVLGEMEKIVLEKKFLKVKNRALGQSVWIIIDTFFIEMIIHRMNSKFGPQTENGVPSSVRRDNPFSLCPDLEDQWHYLETPVGKPCWGGQPQEMYLLCAWEWHSNGDRHTEHDTQTGWWQDHRTPSHSPHVSLSERPHSCFCVFSVVGSSQTWPSVPFTQFGL